MAWLNVFKLGPSDELTPLGGNQPGGDGVVQMRQPVRHCLSIIGSPAEEMPYPLGGRRHAAPPQHPVGAACTRMTDELHNKDTGVRQEPYDI